METLEEAAERFYPPTTTDLICSPKLVRDAFIAGANYMAKNMPIHILDVENTKVSIQEEVVIVEKNDKTLISYSEEKVEQIAKDAYAMGRNNILIGVFNKWFEQIKKK